ncbi:MAG: cupin domain-containing protein [Geminicoccaceae bacterium]
MGKQGFTYGAGASAETVGATRICMNVLPMPPGARARAHYHEGIETIAYLLEGRCTVRFGQRLEHRVELSAGEQGCPPTCRTRRATTAAPPASGSWCIRPGSVTRTAS